MSKRRTRFLRAVCVSAGLAVVVGIVPHADASHAFDWMTVRYTASREVEFDFKIYAELIGGSDKTLVYGASSGVSGPGAPSNRYNWGYVEVLGGRTSQDVAASVQGVGTRQRFHLPPPVSDLGSNRVGVGVDDGIRLRAGQSYAFAAFVPQGRIGSRYRSPAPSGVRVVERTGRGSTAIRVADLRNTGVGIEAGSVGAGALVHSVKAPQGLVGAAHSQCNCVGEWDAPYGRYGRWQAIDTYAGWIACWCSGAFGLGDAAFAGAAGDWRWTTAGLSGVRQVTSVKDQGHSSPVVAGYAPVGDDWKLFAGRNASLL